MKEALSLRFSRSARTYSKWAVPQRESAKILVDFIKPEGKILDLGCGTGFVSEFIESSELIVGTDISFNMCFYYGLRFPCVINGDAENLPFKDKTFDYSLSNFTLHWTNMERSLKEMMRVSKKVAGFSVPVKGSVDISGFPYPEERKIFKLLEGNEYEYFIKEIEIPFKGSDLIKFFHYTGSSLNPQKRKNLSRKELKELSEELKDKRVFFRVLFVKILL